jgi:starch synthase
LEGILKKRAESHELSGILNGIDESWDSKTCSSLSRTFGAGDWEERAHNADDVREQFGLAVSRRPLFALVARLIHQKGVDLVLESAQTIVDAGGQIVVTGKGEARFEEALLQAQERSPGSIAVKIGFDDEEARRIFAGSDFTLIPSRFEPCGLSQMYAQRFGSLPIGHRNGGLAETILDGETGFLFGKPSAEGFLGGLCRAFSTFGMKDRLDGMRRTAMSQAFSWTDSARSYAALYKASIQEISGAGKNENRSNIAFSRKLPA